MTIGAQAFSEKEVAYLKSQSLARIATVSSRSQPDVAPVGFEFTDNKFYVGGLNLPKSLKFRNIQAGNSNVAFVIDDLAPGNSWQPRGIKVHGTAEIVSRSGTLGAGTYICVSPLNIWSWGIEEPSLVMEDGREGKAVYKKSAIRDGQTKVEKLEIQRKVD